MSWVLTVCWGYVGEQYQVPAFKEVVGFVREAGKGEGSGKKQIIPETVRTKTDLASITLKKENIYFLTLSLEISMFLYTE